MAGIVVNPGEVATPKALKGHFAPGTNAVLRVYSGATQMSDILAVSRGSPSRLDVVLEPGANHLTVTDGDGRLAISPGEREP